MPLFLSPGERLSSYLFMYTSLRWHSQQLKKNTEIHVVAVIGGSLPQSCSDDYGS